MRVLSTAMLVLVLLACETTPRAPETPRPSTEVPSMPIPVIETPAVLPSEPPTDDGLLDEGELDEPVAPGAAREIHPHGGMSDCLEMYSSCAPDPATPGAARCTSAPLLLACGQSGTIPGGERLLCVCP